MAGPLVVLMLAWSSLATVHHLAASLRGLDQNGQGILHLVLAGVISQKLRSQASVERKIVFREIGSDRARRAERLVGL